MKNKLLTTVAFLTLFGSATQPAFAVSTPDFGSCLNPQVSASQVNGGNNHGVAGQTATYAGTDYIYKLSNGNVTQCLCPDNGSGIQTNWLKTSGLSEADINTLKNEGWIYVATGASWGLSDDPYLAKNMDYSCKGTTTTTTNTTNITNITNVLGLASTGNAIAIYGLILAGVTSLLAGLLLNKFSK